MADPRAFVPYHDPYEGPLAENILTFMDDANPTLADVSYSHPTLPPSDFDPLEDPVMWDICNDSNNEAGTSQAGPSEVRAGTRNTEGQYFEPQSARDWNMRPLSFWPVAPIPFNCSCCQVLREIIYTNGTITKKLEIHGRLGMICHAILQNLQNVNVNVNSSSNQYQMFDIEDVKQFLVNYCVEQKLAGYVMVQDPLSFFYEALCVGLDWDEDPLADDFFQQSPTNSEGARQMDIEPDADHEKGRTTKVSLAAQRERAGKLTLKDVGHYFHLPIEEAARRMKLCPTVLKKICRRDGMNRWPHRKVKSIQRQISSLTASLDSNNAEARANAQAEIDRLQRELTNVCAGRVVSRSGLSEERNYVLRARAD
ncbi:hypothetical protein FH972_018005 [Carpinus fangiana]|uniref:RWP-RK domain-containing protein n=1 Tax=Carpinus fangiana TaxID=176857 RepID=A0A5N6RP18_9ROSI|nr:hypothetical protein FH972_018005 [Carpinus fangiana]